MLDPLMTADQKEAAAKAEKVATEKASASPAPQATIDTAAPEASRTESQTSQSLADAEVSFDIG